MRKVILSLALLFSLAGCGTISAAYNAVIDPAPNVVAGLESTLALADDAETTYLKLPSCLKQPAPTVCRSPAIVTKLSSFRANAYAALTAAEANETADLITAAQNAVTAYKSITDNLQTQPAGK